MDNSRITSISFTVEDDLISESSLNSTKRSAFRGLKPFSKQYGLSEDTSRFDQRPLPNQQNKKIIERAQMDAYRQLNDQMFNPFEHKLGGNFIPKENNLYEQEKRRQLMILKQKEEQMMASKKSYTIVFNNDQKSKHNLQRAGQNVISEDASISDYYNMKFKKDKPMENIDEEDDEHQKQDKKVNNYIVQPRQLNKSSDGQTRKENISTGYKSTTIKRKSEEVPVKQNEDLSTKQSRESIRNSEKNIQSEQNKVRTPPPPPVPKKRQVKPPTPPVPQQQKNPPQKVEKKPVEAPRKAPVPRASNNSNKNAPKKATGKEKKKYSEVYDGPDRVLVQQLERELTECPTISFDDIAELETAKGLLQEAVLLPRLMPQFFQGIRKAMKGILLFGPPGTGKTLLAKAIAKDNIFLNVSASSLASKWKGQSEKMVRLLFEIAKYHSPSVIFFDEIDAVGSRRSENEHESARKVKTELLVQMDGVGSSDSQVFVLAATNRPWDLDEALRRRLEKRIYIPLPGKVGRRKMFDINLKDVKISPNIDWDKLVENTKGCSGADICNVCRDAAYMPMRRKLTQLGGIQNIQTLQQTDLTEQQITEKDLLEASKKVKPSVGKDDLKRYQSWMAQFGSS